MRLGKNPTWVTHALPAVCTRHGALCGVPNRRTLEVENSLRLAGLAIEWIRRPVMANKDDWTFVYEYRQGRP